MSEASTSELINPEMLILQTDMTIVCEGGGMADLQCQLSLMGKEGIIIGFSEKSYQISEDYLDMRSLEKYLLHN